MNRGRLEAFSDAVIAIIITIMVLELTVPHGEDWSSLTPLIPVFVSYVLSFTHLGIYWNNHHHMLHAATRIDGRVLWANLHLLFWLSLMPFVTAWMGENRFAPIPVLLYGCDLFLAGVAYAVLARTLAAANGPDSPIAKALGRDFKSGLSLAMYAAGIATALFYAPISLALYVAVAVMWFVPDRRMARAARD
jgi:uncharacterized membrane protein